MLLLIVLLAVSTVCRAASSAPEREKRVALVIGIDEYRNAPRLSNPINDAHSLGSALRVLGFEVTELRNPGLRQMSEGVREFGIKAQGADVAVVYYAGHGVQAEHENYLLPSDAILQRERDLVYEALPLSVVLDEVSQTRKVGIVLLDSCRNNPFLVRMSRSARGGRGSQMRLGLARVDNVPPNTLVAMSTRANEVAADGTDHSPFAAALIKELEKPGLELGLFFRSVHDSVLAATQNRQEPYVFSSLGAEPFFFHPRPPSRPPEIGAIAALQVADNAGPTPLGLPHPKNPDGNPLTVRIVGLPASGQVLVGGRPLARNESLPIESFMTATYKPGAKSMGPVGSLDFLIEDGLGGSVAANLPIIVVPSHHPAIVEGPRTFRAYPEPLGIPPPTSPDGDALSVVIRTLPRGIVRHGDRVVRVGDKLQPAELATLTFMPEPGYVGSAGILLYAVDNGRGDIVEGRIDIEVTSTPDTSERVSLGAVWQKLRAHRNAREVQSFLSLFPASPFAGEARQLLQELGLPQAAPEHATPPASAPIQPVRRPEAASMPMPAQQQGREPEQEQRQRRQEAVRVIQPIPPPNPVPETASKPNQFQDCDTCPVMTKIPAGAFVMGQGARDPEATPPHRVTIGAFAIGRYPITIGEWNRCVAAGRCKPSRQTTSDGRAPVHNVSWDDATRFTSWLSETTGKTYRLPSEAEWEYAARGGTNTRYWWGDAIGVTAANCIDCGGNQNPHAPLAVDMFKPNRFGMADALGGIAEWTQDCWFPSYRGAPDDGRAREARGCDTRVLRGGSYRRTHEDITVTSRNNYDQSVRYPLNGFRVARELD